MLGRVDPGVDFSLGPVQWIGSFAPAAENGFDFLDEKAVGSLQHAIDAAADCQNEFRLVKLVLYSNFSLIAGRPQFLNLLMAARTFQSARRGKEIAFSAEIPRPQDELDHLTDRDAEGPWSASGNALSHFCLLCLTSWLRSRRHGKEPRKRERPGGRTIV